MRGPCLSCGPEASGRHLSQHVLQHAAVGVVLPFLGGVDANLGLEFDGLAIGLSGGDADFGRTLVEAIEVEHFRSEEHTSELQSLMRISYAGFCLKNKNKQYLTQHKTHNHIK